MEKVITNRTRNLSLGWSTRTVQTFIGLAIEQPECPRERGGWPTVRRQNYEYILQCSGGAYGSRSLFVAGHRVNAVWMFLDGRFGWGMPSMPLLYHEIREKIESNGSCRVRCEDEAS